MSENTKKPELKFDKSIVSTTDDLISTSDLISRLNDLHEELSTIVQDSIELTSLDEYSKGLVNKKLLRHKDNGVRTFVGCCLSDILRLYAPNAPYTDIQLTDIFKLTLSLFEQLGDPENGYYTQQTYLITKLLEYRSIVLITDLPTSNKLIEELFQIFYDDSKSFQPKLYTVIGGILGEVISEFESVPLNVLKIIFNKFLTYNPKEIPKGLGVVSNCGYELTLILCDVYSNRISRQLTKYYSEILYHATKDEENSFDPDTKLISTMEKLHKLVFRIWETVPDLIPSVIGFAYHELSSDNEKIRKLATKLVGNLISVDSNINFVTAHQDVFNAWISKIADIDTTVRVQWIETIPDILSTRDDVSDEIGKGLTKAFIDSDPQARISSVKVFEKVFVIDIWKNIHEPSVYSSLIHLAREKNKDVRELCIKTLGKFYSDSLIHIERCLENRKIWEIVDTIPSTLFNLYYINDLNINEQVDNVLFEDLLPLEPNDSKRVNRLLTVLSNFDQKAFSSFFAFNKRQLQMALALSKYIEFCKYLNSNEEQDNDEKLPIQVKYHKTVEWLSSGLFNSKKATESLKVLKMMNDSRLFYLIESCISNEAPISTVRSSLKELTTKLKDQSLFRKYDIPTVSTIMPRDLAYIIKILLYRASPIIYNISNISLFFDQSTTTSIQEVELKRKLLENVSKVNPTVFKDQIVRLTDMIKYLNEKEIKEKEGFNLTEITKTLYKIVKALNDKSIYDDTFFMSKLKDFGLEGPPVISKYAAKLISLSPNAEETLTTLKNLILPLNIKTDIWFTSHIAVLMEIFKFHPHILTNNSTDAISYLIKEVLLTNQITGNENEGEEEGDRWITDEELLTNKSEQHIPLVRKILTLKLLTNKLRSISSDIQDDDLAMSFTEKTIKLFFYMIASGGELISENNTDNYPTPNVYQTKLRCCSGLQILKLAKISTINDFIKAEDIVKLVNLVEDESLPVRRLFLDKLKENISNELISIKFLPLVFFTAYEPDNDLKVSTKTWINYTAGKEAFRKGTFFERVLPRLIHAISHHPDVTEGLNGNEVEYTNALRTSIDYLIFYFDSIASQENFSLLYYLSERIKNYKDVIENEEVGEEEVEDTLASIKSNSERMYIIGELAQMILLQLKGKRGWQHSAYPGKLNLPSDLFKPFDSVKEAQASFKTYIDEKYAENIQSTIKMKVSRIIHTSQTQRQKAQKRLLANEYQPSHPSPSLHKRKKTKTSNESDSDKENEGSDKPYVPGGKKVYNGGLRKNLRERKNVDYKDEDEDDDDLD